MNLPFLKNKTKEVGGMMQVEIRKPDDPDKEAEPMEAVAMDLIDAVMSKDVKRLAEALRSAFAIMESEPQPESTEQVE